MPAKLPLTHLTLEILHAGLDVLQDVPPALNARHTVAEVKRARAWVNAQAIELNTSVAKGHHKAFAITMRLPALTQAMIRYYIGKLVQLVPRSEATRAWFDTIIGPRVKLVQASRAGTTVLLSWSGMRRGQMMHFSSSDATWRPLDSYRGEVLSKRTKAPKDQIANKRSRK